ncbi:MAG: hypothetical protein QOI06_158 [Nocardioidaceae bacterium]|jgi:uncharacterized membrane protein YcaP (DUF421 family)|nr:hypothetical protein [Nocardioidaceae bacterium]
MWNAMWTLGISAPEKIIRTIVVYAGLALLLRLAGKRDLAQLNSFDLVVMLLLSNVVQNAVIGNDVSLTGGLLGAAVLVAFNAVVVRASLTSDLLTRLLEGHQTVLARKGKWDTKALRREGLRQADVDAALRRQNANSVDDAEQVSLEPGGAVVVSVSRERQSATKADVDAVKQSLRDRDRDRTDSERWDRVEAKLDELLARQAG